MERTILSLMMGIMMMTMLVGTVSADLGEFKQNQCVPIITVLNSSYVNISVITSPSGIVNTNLAMTKIGNSFNYTFCTTTVTGTYNYGYCDDGGNCYGNSFTISPRGDVQDNNFTQTAFFIGLALLMSMFVYLKVSRFFGSLMIFLVGIGTLFASTSNGWVGWIIAMCGFLMIIYSALSPKRNRGGFRRR